MEYSLHYSYLRMEEGLRDNMSIPVYNITLGNNISSQNESFSLGRKIHIWIYIMIYRDIYIPSFSQVWNFTPHPPERNNSCFGNILSRTLLSNLFGFDDVLMSSFKKLAANVSNKGKPLLNDVHSRITIHFLTSFPKLNSWKPLKTPD